MNLFICYTPLHALIAKKLIEDKKIDSLYVLYYYEADSEKNRYYFGLLAAIAEKAVYARKDQSFKDIFSLFRDIKSSNWKPITTAYCGNIKTMYSRLVLWFFKPSEVNTFDDGMANMNLDPSGYFARDDERWFSRVFFFLFGPGFLYKNLKKRLQVNYTIYKLPNVFPNSIYLDVFGVNKNLIKTENERKPKLNILLAGVLAMENVLPKDEERRLYKMIITEKNIDLVINHPRQVDVQISGHNNISTSIKIAEDQIMELIKDYNVSVYGTFYSTVLVNIPVEIKRVNVLVTGSKDVFSGLNELFTKLGIENVFIRL